VFIIRKFKPRDMFYVIKLASETLTERYNPSLFSYFYEIFPDGFIVVEYNGRIIGFIIGVLTSPHSGRILMIGVSPKHRGKGMGSRLIEELLQEFINRNISYVDLEVSTDNEKAISFYHKHGFRIIDHIKQFYQDGRDAYVMRRLLSL